MRLFAASLAREHDRVRILVVDRSLMFRDALCDVLSAEPDMDAVGVDVDVDTVFDLVQQYVPAVAIIEIPVLDRSGIHLVRQLHLKAPYIRLITVAALSLDYPPKEMIRLGIAAQLTKGVTNAEIIATVRRVATVA